MLLGCGAWSPTDPKAITLRVKVDVLKGARGFLELLQRWLVLSRLYSGRLLVPFTLLFDCGLHFSVVLFSLGTFQCIFFSPPPFFGVVYTFLCAHLLGVLPGACAVTRCFPDFSRNAVVVGNPRTYYQHTS